jgi:hypothetical protein
VEGGSEGESEERARSGRGAERVVEGGNLNQLNNQTAVHERRAYMLYSKMRNKSMKRDTTEGGRQAERETGNMCNDEQIRRQGRVEALSNGSMQREEDKREEEQS